MPEQRYRLPLRIQAAHAGIGAADPLIDQPGTQLAEPSVERRAVDDVAQLGQRAARADPGDLVVSGPLPHIREVRQVVDVVSARGSERVDQQTDLKFGTAPMFGRIYDAKYAAAVHWCAVSHAGLQR